METETIRACPFRRLPEKSCSKHARETLLDDLCACIVGIDLHFLIFRDFQPSLFMQFSLFLLFFFLFLLRDVGFLCNRKGVWLRHHLPGFEMENFGFDRLFNDSFNFYFNRILI